MRPTPARSRRDGGDEALVSAPPTGLDKRLLRVRVRDGAVLQEFPAVFDNAGFADGDEAIWIRTAKLDLYRRP